MADDNIKYSDIITPDESIEKLIGQLEDLNKTYENAVKAIRAGADKIVKSIKDASGATETGRKAIDEASVAATRLERAQKELRISLSDTGKEIAILKARTADANKSTVEHWRSMQYAATSYDKIKADLKETIALYKSLTVEERQNKEMGGQLLTTIIDLKSWLKFLDEQMKPHAAVLSEVEKAEAKLAYLQSNEGQKLLELKAKIAELTSARRSQKTEVDKVAQAQEKLVYATSDENRELKGYSLQIREANKVAQLEAQIRSSAEGSYNRLSAQYALNKIRLNQMSQAEREAVDSGKKLEAETAAIYKRMIELQEATGNYRLSVGHYQRAWDGLGFSIAQVVRELPSLAVSTNTFMLAISNNVPAVVDEINKIRIKNKQLAAEGKETVNVVKEIGKAFLSWNTILVVVLSLLSAYGEEIFAFIERTIKGKNTVNTMTESLSNLNKELENTNNDYGNSVVSIKKLSAEWKNLKTTAEKNQWIRDNKSEFDKLDISIRNINDAENLFVKNTRPMILALKFRAKAAAAQKLAADEYEKALRLYNEAETEAVKNSTSTMDKLLSYLGRVTLVTQTNIKTISKFYDKLTPENFAAQRIQDLRDEAKVAEQNADAYSNLANIYEKMAKSLLKAYNIDEKHKDTKKTSGRKREPVNLTRTINQNDIKVQKLYEESITKLQDDEYAKRRKSAADQVKDANNRLREMYRMNVEYINNVGGKYKKLTEEQKTQIEKQQKLITDTVANNLQYLANQLKRIQREQQVNSLRLQREAVNSIEAQAAIGLGQNQETTVTTGIVVTRDTSSIEASLVEERRLMEENLKTEYDLILDTNKKLRDAGDEQARSEEEILIELNKKKLELWSEYDQKILNQRQTNIEAQLELVQKGSDKELKLLLEQNEIRRQLALAENAAKPAEQQVSSSVINAQFDKSRATITGTFNMTAFEQQQELDKAIFEEVKHNELEITKFKLEQERARWQKQIELAEAGGLEWSQKQIDAAKATVKGLDRELADVDDIFKRIGEKGLGGTLLEKLGFDEDQIDAISQATSYVVSQLQEIMAAEVELAQAAVNAANERVDKAQSAYEAEIEARNNGYANNVATAKKELDEEKKNQRKRQKILAEAQRRQEALNTVMQASNLITASSLIWAQLGFPWAIPALAAMWGSFAVAKIKARQVTATKTEEYGEGGLEFLEGGSHASGNDIDLGVDNSKKRRMRAEGGEALAIINKRQTRKYKKVLPEVIESFNKGTFEDKYLNAFASAGDNYSMSLNYNSNVDLSRIEDDLRNIRKSGEMRCYTLPNGTTIIQYKNVKRIIKN